VDVLVDRLAEAGATDADAVVLAAAGSSDPRAAGDVEWIAEAMRARRTGPVSVGYGAGCDPRVPDAVATARAAAPGARVVIASYLLAPGYFHDQLIKAGADVVTAPLGADPRVAAIVVSRYEEALEAARVSRAGR
jgi:sirohydrochlorin ferrochelatase